MVYGYYNYSYPLVFMFLQWECQMSHALRRSPWALLLSKAISSPSEERGGTGSKPHQRTWDPKMITSVTVYQLTIYLSILYIYTLYTYIYVSMIIYWRHFKTKVMFLSFNWGNWFLGDWIVDGGCKDLMARGYQLCWYWTKPIFLECKSHWSHRNNQLF